MTRWARSGSTQKHKKQPGDATPWSEFANKGVDKSASFKQKKGFKQKKWKNSEKIGIFRHSDKPEEKNVNQKVKVHHDSSEELQSSSKKLKTFASFHQKDKMKKKRKEKNRVEMNAEKSLHYYVSKADGSDNSANKNGNNKSIMPQKEERNVEETVINDEIENPSPHNVSQKKKKMKFLKKLQKKRAEKGIILLPSKVERRLYNIKKRLREKRLPQKLLIEIIRRERRKEELKFRKTFNTSKPCFNCRKPGHILADCPEKQGSSNQETGICFKCGSAEHTSFKCPNKVQGFPYAKCFICKEQGHISRDCPDNKHGVYPKGGRCNLCGNVNHLKKDCPSLIKKKNEESAFTLSTIDEATSIDDEVLEGKSTKPKNAVKKSKIVKF